MATVDKGATSVPTMISNRRTNVTSSTLTAGGSEEALLLINPIKGCPGGLHFKKWGFWLHSEEKQTSHTPKCFQ